VEQTATPTFGRNPHNGLQILSEDADFIFCRGWCSGAENSGKAALAVFPASSQPRPAALDRLTHEFSLRDELDSTWAARPLDLVQDLGRTVLVLEDPGGELLSGLLGAPMEVERFLCFAIGLVTALGKVHQRGLVHKDIKPTNILVNIASGEVRLTGFGMASRVPRERQPPDPPEVIAGTLAYMAPEQTGRMSRSIDSRSDLYSLGVTFYEMLTGSLPFTASDPMEWVHCHIARQAETPRNRASIIPEAVSSIVMKLLAKTAEERYQTAAGVESDLRRCLGEWQSHRRIDLFPLGAHDASDRLLIAEELYGRETEIAALLAAFDRVIMEGRPELVLVSGYSGIGKSSVVDQLHKVLVPPRGLFAAGKFDQYKRDIPYATLAQSFQSLIRQILVKSEAEVDEWRRALAEALGAHGQLIVDLVPELQFIIGKQPAVPDLPPEEAQNRFKLVFRRFLGAFATREHPLALFLDDLQWLDAATLDLIEDLVTHAEVRHLLLVGAYRDNEVDPAHPLFRKLESIKSAGARVAQIALAPLGLDDLGRLTGSALHCDVDRVRPLAQLVHEKTGGNPFFAIQFLTELAEEGLLVFDPAVPSWQWDLGSIRAKNYTGNVVELVAGKLRRLSPSAQDALKELACLGNASETFILIMVHGDGMHAAFAEAVHAGLVVQQERVYKFLHDRIQQAAYSLISDGHRADVHLGIGRVLLASMTADQLAEHLFDVANQLNQGAARLTDRDEKAQVATINLRAGRKAKASAAYASALAYFSAGRALLNESDWTSRYGLTLSLWLECAECELLTGGFDEAAQLIKQLLPRAASKVDEAAAYCLNVRLHFMRSDYKQAADVALACLRRLGIDIPAHPIQDQVKAEYETLRKILDGRLIESLINLPLMTDPELQAAMQIFSVLLVPAYSHDIRLYCVLVCRMVQISLRHGTSDASAFAFVTWGFILGAVFHRYSDGYGFAKLACDLVAKHGLVASRASIYVIAGVVAFWVHPIAAAIDFERRALRAAIETGEPAIACIAMWHNLQFLLMRNDPLDVMWREVDLALEFARRAKFGDALTRLESHQRFIATMQGRTATFSTFSDIHFDEATFESRLGGDRMTTMICGYWVIKLKARFLSGDYPEALAAADKAKALLPDVVGQTVLPDYFYYTALTVSALYETVSAGKQRVWDELLTEHREQLREWAENNTPTFGDRHALVGAEIARIEGRDLDAMRLYEQAIRSAHTNGFVHNEGLAYEVAARFYSARGSETSANVHLRNARACYLRWGADGKVRQLDRLYPHLAAPEGQHAAAIVGSPLQQLDVASVVKASQALSSEIELPKLIEQLMTIAIENAGADRGLLILPSGAEYLIRAEARATGDQIEVMMRQEPMTRISCPESLVRYVIRTQESVIVDDASKPNLFSGDDYLRDRESKSILCLPLIKQQQLAGILLLENTLTSHALSADRIAVLELLAAQAAISLENTRLYSDLQEREAKIRRLVDSNIIGICVFEIDRDITEANDAFLNIVGYSRDDVISGRLNFAGLTPPEWAEADERLLAELASTGTWRPCEKEFFRKDNSRVSALVGGATFGELRQQGVAFVVDLTDRKRAEEERERLRQLESELAHVNRLNMMGELAASLAHEILHPIATARNNARSGMRFLEMSPPDLNETREALSHVVRDVDRATDIVGRIRDHIRKAPPQRELFDLNGAVSEVIVMVQATIAKNGIAVGTRLKEGLALVPGDRVQLQQVIMNLILNAIEAMSSDEKATRELSIGTEQSQADVDVLVEVRDSGPGIDLENLDRVFEPFYTTKGSGNGMGLSICRSIVEAHGGRLWATPNEPRGAVFCFTLPLTGAERKAQSAQPIVRTALSEG
jgi:PAS domain S-box-containing protein